MQKVALKDKEKVKYKVSFSKRIFLVEVFTLIFMLILTAQLGNTIYSFLLLILFIPVFIFTVMNFRRIFFHRIYITEERVIYVKGYWHKTIDYYNIKDITGVFYYTNPLNFRKQLATFKCTMKEQAPFILKNIKYGTTVADILSKHLVVQQSK